MRDSPFKRILGALDFTIGVLVLLWIIVGSYYGVGPTGILGLIASFGFSLHAIVIGYAWLRGK